MLTDTNRDKQKNTLYDCIIIGGGISGISFAHYLHQQKITALILEKEDRIGGQVKTGYSDTHPHFWYEMGPHTCYNSYENFQYIIKDTTDEEIIQPMLKYSYMLYKKGKIKSLFAGVYILPLLFRFPLYFFRKRTNKTVRQYFKAIVGKSNYNRLFTRAFRAVLCQNADEYPAEMFLKKRSVRDEYLPRKYTFKRGFTNLLETIIKKDNLNIRTSTEVVSIEKISDEKGVSIFKVTINTGEVYYTPKVVLATDPVTTSHLIKDIDKDIAGLLSTIPLFRSESVNVILPKDKVSVKEIAGIIPMSDEFLSVVSRDLVEDTELRSFTFHFEKGKSEEEKLSIICKVLGVNGSDIIEQKILSHILPSVRLQHLYLEDRLNEMRKEKKIYIIGNYFLGLSLEDCVQRARNESERFILDR